MEANELSLRKLATILGVSQPFLSQIRAGKRPLPEALKTKVQALGAYHLLIGYKQIESAPGGAAAAQTLEIGVKYVGGGEGNRTPGPLHAKQVLSR